jgi:pimeloyl-ACP methyl ester carboxylesterase
MVVLIHGAADRAATFQPTRRALAPLPVLSYDRRGYAGSIDLAVGAGLAVHVADLLEVVDERPSVLIGHSFGGLIALAAAVEEPELVRAVGVYEPPLAWLGWWPAVTTFGAPETAAETFFREVVGGNVWEGLPDQFRADRRREGAALISDFSSAQSGLPFDLGDVLSPVAAAHGSRTTAHFERAAQTIAANNLGAALTVIEGAAHGVHQSHPVPFASWIRSVVALAV